MTYAGLGLGTLTMAGLVVWGIVQRLNKRSQAEGDLDQRIPALLDAAVKPWQEVTVMQKSIIDEERKEKARAQDEREGITKQFIEYATVQTQQNAADLAKMRDHFADGQRRLYERLESVERHRVECDRKLEEAERRITQFEERQFNTALLTPVVTVPGK